MKRIVVWGVANYNWLWVPLAERLKRATGAAVHFICMNRQDVEFFREMDKGGVIDDFVTTRHFFESYDELDVDEESVFRRARANESAYGVLAVDLLQADRHLGRGFSSLAPYYPRSRLSEKASYVKSLNFFNSVLAYWEDYFEKRQPDLMIGTPAGFIGKCCCLVARRRDITMRELGWAKYLDCFTWYENEFWAYPRLKEAFKTSNAPTIPDGDGWPGGRRSNYEGWMRRMISRRSLWITLRKMWKTTLIHAYQRWKRISKVGNCLWSAELLYLWRNYLNFKRLDACRLVTAEELAGVDYVYCPLHLEPESALSGFSPEFNEQMAVVELIAKNLPAGVKIAVKENLWAIGSRPADLYRTLKDIPNLVMISPREDSLAPIRGSLCVAIISGTAGFEAAAMGIPVIAFGLHNSYDFVSHVHVVKSWTELRGLLRKVCLEERGPEAKARRREEGARLLEAVRASAVDLAGVDYTSSRRPRATEEEVERLFTHLMATLKADGETASREPVSRTLRGG